MPICAWKGRRWPRDASEVTKGSTGEVEAQSRCRGPFLEKLHSFPWFCPFEAVFALSISEKRERGGLATEEKDVSLPAREKCC